MSLRCSETISGESASRAAVLTFSIRRADCTCTHRREVGARRICLLGYDSQQCQRGRPPSASPCPSVKMNRQIILLPAADVCSAALIHLSGGELCQSG